jgi:L-fucose isomerase-like protein
MTKVVLVSNGDFRDSVGVNCWPKQEETLLQVENVFNTFGVKTERANPYKEDKQHGFINTQAEACRIFSVIHSDMPVVIVLSSWVWAHHIASSLKLHKGPVLILGNFDGTWPGLVSLLNHSSSFDRMGIKHSKIWTDSFAGDPDFMNRLKAWISNKSIRYSNDHKVSLDELNIEASHFQFGKELAKKIRREKRILGQMDPGCMGMLNAVMSPDIMAEIAFPLELLSQSDLLAEMDNVSETVILETFRWLQNKKVKFHFGKDDDTDLTEDQILEQMRMYHAAGRIYKRYGLSAIGIPYQYGLVRCTCASDLPEGMLNNSDRPDIVCSEAGIVIQKGKPIIHFNEGDLGSAVPQVLMNEILTEKKMPLETTLHDIRWGKEWNGSFIWTLEISGGAPPAHYNGWDKVDVYRQTPMYFPKGGGTCSGVSHPGVITWARFYESYGKIGMDIGIGKVVKLPEAELLSRRERTSSEWPIANAVFPGYGRDELMSSHRSNHITICYGNIIQELASACMHLGIPVDIIGDGRNQFGS